MSDAPTSTAARLLRRAAVPAGLVLAFLLGGALLGGGRDDAAPSDDEHAQHEPADAWTCSMHPQVRASEPGQCPICGMDLIAVGNAGDDQRDNPTRISLSKEAAIRARIRTALVRRLPSRGVERRLLGRVTYDETRLRTVTSWIGGRIDRLHVKTTGQRIRRGQVIATLYSPEVFAAHQDLLVARRQAAKLGGATESARLGAQAALDAARDRLRLLGVPAAEIEQMEQASRPSEQVRIRSPFAGTVIERLATEGDYVQTGTGLYQVADLSKLWVQLDAYESDLSLLKIGQPVSLRVEALPTEVFEGRVMFVDPVLDQRTRTTQVRIEVANSRGELRPNMFAEAVVREREREPGSDGEPPLVIPDTAPLFTGRRSVVYVEVPGAASPTYEARIVRLGPRTGDVYPVIAGLSVGERVVIHGAFTLDADLQIRGGLSMMTAPDDWGDGPYDDIVAVPDEYEAGLAAVVDSYLAVHEALASDSLAAAKSAGRAVADSAGEVRPDRPEQFVSAWLPLARQLSGHAKTIGDAGDLDEARLAFRDLSQQIATLLRVFGNPAKQTVRLAFCPMALDGEGAEWVQRASTIENPYYGASMHTCGEVHSAVEHGTYLPMSGEDAPAPSPANAPAGGHEH